MSTLKKLILIGGGGHCTSCIDVIEQENKYAIVGILDKEISVGQKKLGYPFVGLDSDIKRFVEKKYFFLITIGQIKTAFIRQKIYSMLNENNALLATVVSPRAYVSKHATIGKGTIIMHDALINAASSIGENCIINTKALIEHDAVIENFCHVSTSAIVNGKVKIKEGSFFGSNAVSKENVTTGKNCFIKAGSIYKGQ